MSVGGTGRDGVMNLAFSFSIYFCLSIASNFQFSAPLPTRRSVNSSQGAAAYTAKGQRCCTLHDASQRPTNYSTNHDSLQRRYLFKVAKATEVALLTLS